jgi:septal ring-binding cell division protein DamX
MLIAIASELGIATQGSSTTQLLRGLQGRLVALHAEGRQVVALIDEAHAMPLATLEEIRLLSNLETGKAKLLQIVLFGQPELDEHLNLPHMRQLKERITHAFNLLPLPPRDIHDYIGFRLRAAGYHGPDLFGPEVLRIISDASEGLTRRINIYADKTLLAAFAAGTHTVSPDHARAAVSDTQIVVAPKTTSRSVALAAAAGLACGIAIGYAGALFLNPAPEIPPPAAAAAPAPAPAQAAVPAPAPAPAAASAPAASPPPPAVASGPVIPAASPPKAAPADPAPAEAPAAQRPKGLESRLSAGIALLDGTSGGRYVVQLMMTDARDPAYLQAYLAEASRTQKPDELFLYPSGSADSPKVGVLYGAFQTRKEASDAMDALPGNLRQFRPYVRAIEAVRNDVRRGPAA